MTNPTAPGGERDRVRRLDPLPIEVARPMVLMRLGYRRPSQVPERTSRLIDEVMERGSALIEPRAVWTEVEVSTPEPGTIVLGGTLRTSSRSVHRRLSTCRAAAVFAATVGAAIDDLGRQWMDAGEMTRALLLDAYGGSAATALGLKVEEAIEEAFSGRGLRSTKRYAPGYGDWDLSDQGPLLAMLDVGRIGIRLTEDHLMLPAKSISGVIGLRADQHERGPADPVPARIRGR